MKIFNSAMILSFFFLFISCEKVVDIELEESEPRLVVEASLVWNIDYQDLPLYIKLSETVPYYADKTAPVSGAQVNVSSEEGDVFLFVETEPGLYKHEGFLPELNTTYSLRINYQGETYEATEEVIPVPPLDYILQADDGGFSGDEKEFRIFYHDPAGIANYYLFKFYYQDKISLQIYDDEFTDGNQTFAFFGEEEVSSGDQVIFQIQGISRRYYDYLFLLRSQTGTSGGPFQSAPTIVKGNITNTTNPGNYPFGFFRLSYSNSLSYQVK